jgi:hypothetical protein
MTDVPRSQSVAGQLVRSGHTKLLAMCLRRLRMQQHALPTKAETQQLSTVHRPALSSASCQLPSSTAEAEACFSTRRALVPAMRDWSAASALLCSLDYVPALCRCPCRTSNTTLIYKSTSKKRCYFRKILRLFKK